MSSDDSLVRQLEEERKLVARLQHRQELLERLSGVQRMIAHRETMEAVLSEFCVVAREHLSADRVYLVTAERGPVSVAQLTATSDADHADEWRHTRAPLERLVASSMAENTFAVDRNRSSSEGAEGPVPAMAAPVEREDGTPVTLVVAYLDDDRRISEHDIEILAVLAANASIVLNDARSLSEVTHAFHDSLTGLPTRDVFLQSVEASLAADDSAGILFVDPDGVKLVNDTLGHTAGDHLLQQVADRLRRAVGDNHIVGRIGGDEFSVLVSQATEVALSALADQVIAALKEPFLIDGRETFIGASIGMALRADESDSAEDLLRNADLAMYAAKAKGSNSIVPFRQEMASRLFESLQTEGELRSAIENDEFVLFYQPILSLATKAITGFEALIRWQHPTKGLVFPDNFIPLAERNGLIKSIDRWVLQAATEQLAIWRRHYNGSLYMSVNVSAHGLLDDNFVEDAERIVMSAGINPASIHLELTETVLIRDLDAVEQRLVRLKEIGFQLSIDDFGTGYSSLTHLTRFPFDYLKIDRSFVSGLVQDPTKWSMVRSIIDLAQALQLQVVAEGIEASGELSSLTNASCQYGQGYFIARPMGKAAAEELLAAAGQEAAAPKQLTLENL